MLGGLLGRGFVPKGKSLIKLTKNRIDVLRRKRTATIKFLKKDLADLLANGLDVNAYDRAGGLLDELKHLWNLDFVERSCDFVYKHLSLMQKISECPEDCREAVSSLMLAASAFSELPELRDLRQMFHDKYGDSLGLFINQELVESLSTKPFSLEKKMKLMEDVASEFSVPWDSTAFEKRISRHNNSSIKELNKNHGLPKASNDKYKSIDGNKVPPIREKYDFSSKEISEGVNAKHSLNRTRADATKKMDPSSLPVKEIYQNGRRGDWYGFSSRERSEYVHNSARSESRNIEVERNKFDFEPRPETSREKHNSLFNEGDTIVMKIKHENLLQRKGHQDGMEQKLKKREDMASRTPNPSSSSDRDEKLSFTSKQENLSQAYKQENCAEHVSQKSEDNASRTPKPRSSSKRTENIDHHGSGHCNGWENRENAVPAGRALDRSLSGNPEIAAETHQSKSRDKDPLTGNYRGTECDYAKLMKKIQEEEQAERRKRSFSNALPPPYVKPNGIARNIKAEAAAYSKTALNSSSETVEAATHPDVDKSVFVPERANDHDNAKDNGRRVNGCIDDALPKRRSSRRHSKSSTCDQIPNPEDLEITKRRTRSRRREHLRKGRQILSDDEQDKDDEEIMIDNLLMHYSRKPSSYNEMRMQPASKSRHSRSEDDEHNGSQRIPPPARSHSLPDQQSEPSEPTKVFARAASFQPDRSSAGKHVHPMLPDYDDLTARFMALKGR
ncbi:PREDICTED: uncharacterized protein LOC104799073 [Tarenaya hassleriana]|uniref:uncharacterized protein LOC104799073 n=1 Tax=Tarenaya hassleriana TaxID=28532 RepID=UPI00053C5F7D|nr:PREDICTED: uncharacterized protein LOC104799073 [Tarenaya hassleriana]